jgi:hypothetical protein
VFEVVDKSGDAAGADFIENDLYAKEMNVWLLWNPEPGFHATLGNTPPSTDKLSEQRRGRLIAGNWALWHFPRAEFSTQPPDSARREPILDQFFGRAILPTCHRASSEWCAPMKSMPGMGDRR